ncbi:formylglycine-generating enzyme family protein [Cyanobium sp. FGCU-6]|nr:formylglycine-generating enzyme family protein [Cyanobium sp. FGCU6]
MTATPTRTATFLLRQPRQVQGFREQLRSDDQVFGEGVFDQGDVFAQEQKKTDLTMLWIPPGRFWIGSPEKELDRQDREGPQHLVQLQGFFMGQTPITQAQWRAVAEWMEQPGETWNRDLKANPAWFDGEKQKMRKASDSASDESVVLDGIPNTDLYPVEQVSWHDAREFCNRLSQRTGRHYTLPSEAQWEYACRAGSSTPFHFGATITPGLANYNGSYTYADGPKGPYREQTTPVGMFPANAWGLHDMHGNVWEWCQDHWHDSYEGAPSNGSAWENTPERKKTATNKERNDYVSDEDDRLLRGGSWNFGPRHCRSAHRFHGRPGNADDLVGFRVVCLPQDPSLNA